MIVRNCCKIATILIDSKLVWSFERILSQALAVTVVYLLWTLRVDARIPLFSPAGPLAPMKDMNATTPNASSLKEPYDGDTSFATIDGSKRSHTPPALSLP